MSKGKGTWGKVQEKPDSSFQVSPPSSHTDELNLTNNCENTCEMSPTEAHLSLVSRIFIGGQSCRPTAPTGFIYLS